EALLLELPGTLGADAELGAGLLEGAGAALVGQAEAKANHVALGLRETVDDVAQLLGQFGVGQLLDRSGTIAGQQVSEGGLAVLVDALVEARQVAAELTQVADLLDRPTDDIGQLLIGRLARELHRKIGLELAQLRLLLGN